MIVVGMKLQELRWIASLTGGHPEDAQGLQRLYRSRVRAARKMNAAKVIGSCLLHSLKLTASLHLEMNGWNTSYLFPFGMAYFQVRTVSFREGIIGTFFLLKKPISMSVVPLDMRITLRNLGCSILKSSKS